jgi:hypothetical protein
LPPLTKDGLPPAGDGVLIQHGFSVVTCALGATRSDRELFDQGKPNKLADGFTSLMGDD